MLIETITFEIHNHKRGIREEYVVENTVEMQEKILQDHYSRNIQFIKMLDMQFDREERVPLSYVDFDDEIDPVDEMVGTF